MGRGAQWDGGSRRKGYTYTYSWFPGGTRGKEPTCQRRRHKRRGFDPWVKKIPWSRKWQPTPAFLTGKSHGQRSLVDYIHRGAKSLTWLKRRNRPSWFMLPYIRNSHNVVRQPCAVLGLAAQSCLTCCDPMDCSPPGSSIHVDSPGINTGVGCHALFQGIFPTRDRTQVFRIAGGFFTIWTTREAHEC